MNTTEKSRRNVLRLAGAGLAATSVATVAANEAHAYQGNMERAVSSLYSALGSLRESTSDKGGHRVKAMRLIQQAITEVQSGIEFAAEKFGD